MSDLREKFQFVIEGYIQVDKPGGFKDAHRMIDTWIGPTVHNIHIEKAKIQDEVAEVSEKQLRKSISEYVRWLNDQVQDFKTPHEKKFTYFECLDKLNAIVK